MLGSGVDRMPSFVSYDEFLKCRQFETFYAWHDLCGSGGNIGVDTASYMAKLGETMSTDDKND